MKADIAEMKISITMWGAKKGNWIEFYTDIKEIIDNLGYEHTHIGIKNGKFSSGKNEISQSWIEKGNRLIEVEPGVWIDPGF